MMSGSEFYEWLFGTFEKRAPDQKYFLNENEKK